MGIVSLVFALAYVLHPQPPQLGLQRANIRTSALQLATSSDDVLQLAVDKVKLAAAAFGPIHEEAAKSWLDNGLSRGGQSCAALRAALHEHDALVAECVLRDDGTIEPRCLEIDRSLRALQLQLDDRAVPCSHPPYVGLNAREWVEVVLLGEQTVEAKQEMKHVLFGQCQLSDECGGPSKCEQLQEAITHYCVTVSYCLGALDDQSVSSAPL